MSRACEACGGAAWVFHAGALGDHVMAWPLIRAMARRGMEVRVVSAASHAALCGREVGRDASPGRVVGMSAESPRWMRMWAGRVEAGDVSRGVRSVVTFVADEASEAGRVWCDAARRMFPGAEVECVGPPGSASRGAAWKLWEVARLGSAQPLRNEKGPAVLFVGAGGLAKRWKMDRWMELAARIGAAMPARLIAGPVERERLDGREREMFAKAGGVWIDERGGMDALAEEIRAARVFAGCDTGPTHLAAQMGAGTVALFGPTDPEVWGPVGPRVRVVRPRGACGMDWLSVDEVERVVREMMCV